MVLKDRFCLNLTFERYDHGQHLKDKPQLLATGVIGNNIKYIWLIVVICNLKLSQHKYDLENPLWDNDWEWCSLRESLGIHVGQHPCEVDEARIFYKPNVYIVAIEVNKSES